MAKLTLMKLLEPSASISKSHTQQKNIAYSPEKYNLSIGQ